MSTEISERPTELRKIKNPFPSIFIVTPFEPKMLGKADLERRMEILFSKIEQRLKRNGSESARHVTENLKRIQQQLDYYTYKQSIAIFVSTEVEKVYYLDFPVVEKIIIDQPFEIRELVSCKKDMHKYLILVLSANRGRIYLGNASQLIRIASNMPEHAAAGENDNYHRAVRFSNRITGKEIKLEKFFRHVDNSLNIILNAYRLPFFVMGSEKTLRLFSEITHQSDRISGYIPGNFEDATERELWSAITPFVTDWKKVKELDLVQQLQLAKGAGKLTYGIDEVADAANHRKGQLLIVEKNFMFFDVPTADHAMVLPSTSKETACFSSKALVDDIIEKVLGNGGDVEFVDEGILPEFDHIALTL